MLNARAANVADSSTAPIAVERNWKRWKVGRIHIFVLLLCATAFAMLLGMRAYGWKGSISQGNNY